MLSPLPVILLVAVARADSSFCLVAASRSLTLWLPEVLISARVGCVPAPAVLACDSERDAAGDDEAGVAAVDVVAGDPLEGADVALPCCQSCRNKLEAV